MTTAVANSNHPVEKGCLSRKTGAGILGPSTPRRQEVFHHIHVEYVGQTVETTYSSKICFKLLILVAEPAEDLTGRLTPGLKQPAQLLKTRVMGGIRRRIHRRECLRAVFLRTSCRGGTHPRRNPGVLPSLPRDKVKVVVMPRGSLCSQRFLPHRRPPRFYQGGDLHAAVARLIPLFTHCTSRDGEGIGASPSGRRRPQSSPRRGAAVLKKAAGVRIFIKHTFDRLHRHQSGNDGQVPAASRVASTRHQALASIFRVGRTGAKNKQRPRRVRCTLKTR